MKAILGRKMGMTSVFAEDGTLYPVTVVEVLPNVVTQVKTVEKDGYVAVQVGYEEKKESRANKSEKGIAKKANTVPHYISKELRGDEMGAYQLGDTIKADLFKDGDLVDVIGTSKGHGYTGTIKRWHMTIGPKVMVQVTTEDKVPSLTMVVITTVLCQENTCPDITVTNLQLY